MLRIEEMKMRWAHLQEDIVDGTQRRTSDCSELWLCCPPTVRGDGRSFGLRFHRFHMPKGQRCLPGLMSAWRRTFGILGQGVSESRPPLAPFNEVLALVFASLTRCLSVLKLDPSPECCECRLLAKLLRGVEAGWMYRVSSSYA